MHWITIFYFFNKDPKMHLSSLAHDWNEAPLNTFIFRQLNTCFIHIFILPFNKDRMKPQVWALLCSLSLSLSLSSLMKCYLLARYHPLLILLALDSVVLTASCTC